MNKGKVTIPTNIGIEKETIEFMNKCKADAIRDCDGTEFPEELKNIDAKIYATYYTTRKDNKWAENNPEEIQQCYIMTPAYTAKTNKLTIEIMKGISREMLKPNILDDIKRWWEVVDRTTGEVVTEWEYNEENLSVVINSQPYHSYTVSFLTFIIWDPVHMYNALTNEWKDFEKQITFDVRQPKTYEYTKKRLQKFIDEHPYVDVIRFTTFFHQFTLICDEEGREKYADWFGYSASVSPYILEIFEKEVGYKFRPEYIIDEGYHNNQYRIPSKEFKDFQRFQMREVAKIAKELVDICHKNNKEAMMFLGDHWIGTEPFMDEFKKIGLDAVVGSVGNGATLRLISDIEGVKYTEGRFLPYFFPDVFNDNGDPVKEAKINWVTARRAILRKPIDRIGYGGYLNLALKYPEFTSYIEDVCDEFRLLYENINNSKPYNIKKVAVLNCWGKMRAWGCHMQQHAIYHKQNYSYAGVIEFLSGAPYDVSFINFEDILENERLLDDIDVIINIGDIDTAQTGGENWSNPKIIEKINAFVGKGGGFIGVGEPASYKYQGKIIQLNEILGVEIENGYTLGFDKYNWEEKEHFIVEDSNPKEINFGEGKNNIYAYEDTDVIVTKNQSVQIATKEFEKGRGVYISGLPYSFENSRILHRAILWCSNSENELKKWFSTNYNVEVHAFEESKKYCIVNNTYEKQKTTVYTRDGHSFNIELEENQIVWYNY